MVTKTKYEADTNVSAFFLFKFSFKTLKFSFGTFQLKGNVTFASINVFKRNCF